MFQFGHRVIRKEDSEVGTVISIIPNDLNSREKTLYEVRFASGVETVYDDDLRAIQCSEKDELLFTFQQAFKIYYRAIVELGSANGNGSDAESSFDFLLRRAHAAQDVCKLAQSRV